MFGFSIQKLLFTVLIVAAVWYGFKWYARVQAIRDSKRDSMKGSAKGSGRVNRGGGQSGVSEKEIPDAEDMVKCGSCGVFVASRGARSCGRADCPYVG